MKHRLVHLDFLRGIAALLVCLGHLRAFLFVPFTEIANPGIGSRIFYFITGLGHQAVVVFFVLSGFLVGGSVISAYQKNKWSWRNYALRRLARLWVVLIPALLLTLFWDQLGQSIAPSGYAGLYRLNYNSGPSLDFPTDLRWMTFLGNTAFLQTISGGCFGTNGPLWSLANEFWYYLLFPLLLSVFLGKTWWTSLIGVGLTVVAMVFLPAPLLLSGLIWLFGAAVFVFLQNDKFKRWTSHRAWLFLSTLLVVGLLVASRADRLGAAGDWIIGAGFTLLIAHLASTVGQCGIYTRVATGLSEVSYTLYLTHFPLLAFIFFTRFHGQQLQPGLKSSIWFLIATVTILIFAAAMWWCFERNTDQIRKHFQSFGKRPG